MHPAPGVPRALPTHMPWAIVSLVLFWPLAIPAIVNASRVTSLLNAGDHLGAQQASQAARR